MREYCIYIKLKTLMQSIALHQWQGRPQPSLTHNLNVSVKEKAIKRCSQFVGCSICPGAGVRKLSIVWILTKYLIVHVTPERGQGTILARHAYNHNFSSILHL